VHADPQAAEPLRNAISQSGFLDVLVPEQDGGAGLSLPEFAPLAIAAGRFLLPVPYAEPAVERLTRQPLGKDAAGALAAARMAGALLSAADLPELICYDLQSYEEKAVALAHQPGECARLRAHLQTVRASGRLFDTDAFAKNLESALEGLVRAL
jgi:hypothetical protein